MGLLCLDYMFANSFEFLYLISQVFSNFSLDKSRT